MPSAAGAERPVVLVTPPAHPQRLVFLGTPQMAVPPLEALCAAGFDVALVVTGPDKRRGRGRATAPTPVKIAALALGIPVSHDVDDAAGCDADLGVVVAFGQILRRPLLEALPLVNLHFSLLPRWRGAAPVERALLAGDERTGVCVMVVEEGLDTGGVYAQVDLAIRRTSTAADLSEQLTMAGSELLVHTLTEGLGEPVPQHGEPTYAHKLTPDDRRLRWHLSAEELHRIVRVGGAWTTFRDRRLKVVDARVDPVDLEGDPGVLVGDRVSTGSGSLQLITVQPEGKSPIAAADWLRGTRVTAGDRLVDVAISS